jgi:hypothetical protein
VNSWTWERVRREQRLQRKREEAV